MDDNKKTKTAKAIIAATTNLAVVASVAMIGIQTQMSQYALAKHAAKHAARDPPQLERSLLGYSRDLSNIAPGCLDPQSPCVG